MNWDEEMETYEEPADWFGILSILIILGALVILITLAFNFI